MTAILTKVKARRARLLTRSDYAAACRQGTPLAAPRPLTDDIKTIRFYLKGISFPMQDKPPIASLKRVRGLETDLRNIMWIWRLKKYHGVDGDAVFPFLNPNCFRLCADEIRRLAYARNSQEFYEIAAGGVYGWVFEKGFSRGEQSVNLAVMAQLRREARLCDFALIYEYLYVRYFEIKNITAINEGLAHGLCGDEILSALTLEA